MYDIVCGARLKKPPGEKPMTLEREWMRGAAPLAVLTLLADREMYGYELVEALENRTDGILAMGQSTVYPLLYNLEGKGHVEPVWRDAPTGRRRKYYRITEAGRGWLATQHAQWKRLVTALGHLGIPVPELEEGTP
jgi:PadR family transcriptional regulator PadR